MGKYLAGIDLGTTALKIAVFDDEGRMLANAIHEYTLYTPQSYFVESETGIYMDSIKKGFSDIAKTVDLSRLAAIGFSNQSETMFFVDKDGAPLRRSISWMDNRAEEQAKRMSEKYGNELCYQKTGQVSFGANWPAMKALWVKENEPELYAETAKILLIEDFIIFQLTGRYVADCAMLCSTLYWDITTKEYWPLMMEEMGVTEAMFPEILEPGEMVGTILPEMAKELGISPATKIVTGAMDNAIGAVGVGAARPGVFSESIGSTLAICVPTEGITYDPNRQMPIHYYPIPDTYMMHTFTTGGMCLRWFRDNFCQLEKQCAEFTGADNYDYLTAQAIKVPAGSEGLIFLPHLNGSLAPDVNDHATGIFFGITLVHRKEHFVRAIMESLGYLLRRNLDALSGMGLEIDEIRAFGGGSKSPLWNQIKADILQKTICVTNSNEAACLGAVILAGHAIGMFESIQKACDVMVKIVSRYEPDPACKEVYDRGYMVYKKLQEDNRGVFDLSYEHNRK